MATHESRPTATIIQFPARRREKAVPALYGASAASTYNDALWPAVECGSGWYHEAAMREADRARRT